MRGDPVISLGRESEPGADLGFSRDDGEGVVYDAFGQRRDVVTKCVEAWPGRERVAVLVLVLPARGGSARGQGTKPAGMRSLLIPSGFISPMYHARLQRIMGSLTWFIPAFLSSGFGPVLASNPVAKIPAVM